MCCTRFTNSRLRYALAAILTLVNPALINSVQAVEPEPKLNLTAPVAAVDVTLTAGGVMQGYVVDAQGIPAANVDINLTLPEGEQIVTKSNAEGRFGYRGLHGGTYQLETEHGVIMFRAWTAHAAPPRAAATLLVVHDQLLARGQWAPSPEVNGFVGRWKRVMTNPFAVAAIVGAAVAIPVAVHNANQDDSSS